MVITWLARERDNVALKRRTTAECQRNYKLDELMRHLVIDAQCVSHWRNRRRHYRRARSTWPVSSLQYLYNWAAFLRNAAVTGPSWSFRIFQA